MRKFLFALAGAAALFSVSASANAAPVGAMDMKSQIARDGSEAQQTHWGRRHCHRRCSWRHGHRHCWRVCHGRSHRWHRRWY